MDRIVTLRFSEFQDIIRKAITDALMAMEKENIATNTEQRQQMALKCYNCNKVGHHARKCRSAKYKRNNGRPRSPSQIDWYKNERQRTSPHNWQVQRSYSSSPQQNGNLARQHLDSTPTDAIKDLDQQ